MSDQKIGFVGVGRMGANMARNLKDRGYTVSAVNDVNKEAAAELATELAAELGGARVSDRFSSLADGLAAHDLHGRLAQSKRFDELKG